MICIEATDTIVLHSNILKIDKKDVVVTNGSEYVVPVANVSFNPRKELMYVRSTVNFKTGDKYVLTIPFMGKITDGLVGYYKSSYVDKENNQTKCVIILIVHSTHKKKLFYDFVSAIKT
jgi:aminopeptidase N